MEEEKSALTPTGGSGTSPLVDPDGFSARMSQFREMAEVVVKSGCAPKGMTRPEQIIMAFQVGHDLGLPMSRALSAVTVINGKPGVMGEAAIGILRSRGALESGTDLTCEYTTVLDQENPDAYSCTVTLHRRGQPDPFAETFSIKDARRARLWGKQGPWTEYPQRMLMWRALGFLLSKHFSDVMLGLPLEAELKDLPKSAPEPANPFFHLPDPPDQTGPDPLLEAVCQGEVDPAIDMEVLPLINPEGEGKPARSNGGSDPS